MEPVLIPCPKCGKHLKLRDPALLGRKGKCPQCEHRFVLAEPEEVQLELADHEVPAVGTAAQWVPDQAPAATATAPMIAPVVGTVETSAVGSARLQAAKQRRKSQLKLAAVVGGVSAVIVGGVAIWAGSQGRQSNGNPKKKPSPEVTDRREPTKPAANRVPKGPRKGQPIALRFIPTGAQLIIHMRPAEIWNTTDPRHDVLACLGAPLGPWLNTKLLEVLQFKPEEVEEALICLYMDVKTEKPTYSVAVKLLKPQQPSTFVERFGGTEDVMGRKVYVRKTSDGLPVRTTVVTDGKGQAFASAPAKMQQDLVNALESPGLASNALDQILRRTDDQRHLTILFSPHDIGDFREHLFPENTHAALDRFLQKFDPAEIEAVAWSFHFGSRDSPDFFSEIMLRSQTITSPRQLQVDMEDRLKKLPGELAGLIQLMRPNTVADRKLVSRLPVMFEAFRVETVPTIGSENERYVKFTTALPRIAGPNLAAATMLTLQLVQKTDFSKPPPVIVSRKVPELVADRLNTKIEIEFAREPLQKAFDYIGVETSIKTDIDGDALKDAGFTKNMPQTFNLGEIPARRAVYEIVRQYEGLALVIDESKKLMILTTEKFAKMKGQKVFPLSP